MFRSLTLFRFGAAVGQDLLFRLTDAVAQRPLRPVGPLEFFTVGFVPAQPDAESVEWIGTAAYVIAARQERMLRTHQVNDEVYRRAQKISEEEGRKVGSRERKRIKEDVIATLLPHAPIRTTRMPCLINTAEHWIAVDTPSRKVAEACVSLLRAALGSFPVVPLAPDTAPELLLTDWLSHGYTDDGFQHWQLGDECELREPATTRGAIARYKRQSLDAEEVQENLRNGKRVRELGVVINDNCSAVLTADLVLKRLKFLDGAGFDDAESREQLQALQVLELTRVATEIFTLFGCARPE